jgi:hypothetical protein
VCSGWAADHSPPGVADALGETVTDDRIRVADLRLSWTESQWLDGQTAGSLGVVRGLPIAGASPRGAVDLSRTGADAEFTKLTFDLKRVQLL